MILYLLILAYIVWWFGFYKPSKVYCTDTENFKKTNNSIYDDLDENRAVDIFLKTIPIVSMEAIRSGLSDIGINHHSDILIFDQKMNSKQLFLTGNTDTVYATTFLNLKNSQGVVLDIPKGLGPSVINDALFEFVTDIGSTGPDSGNGGKYLILSPDSPMEDMDTYHSDYYVYRSRTYTNLFITRVLGNATEASRLIRNGLKIYDLSQDPRDIQMNFINGSDKFINTIHENDYNFYKKLWNVLQHEPTEIFSQYTLGQLSLLGIRKGFEMKHDDRMIRILNNSARKGVSFAEAIAFTPRDNVYKYDDRHWYTPFIEDNHSYTIDSDESYGINIDAKVFFYYIATLNTPSMMTEIINKGSQYIMASMDSFGNSLNGSKTYEINIPKNIPAINFASIAIYDKISRSLITSEVSPSRNFRYDRLKINDDDSITIRVGPETTDDTNHITSIPNREWFALFRLYGPTSNWYDNSWKINDFNEL